jgi:hypothetical protein
MHDDPEMNEGDQMNQGDEMNEGDQPEDDELAALRDELSRVPATDAPPIEAIVSRGRAKRRRRRSRLAGAGVAATVAVAVLLASLGGSPKVPAGHHVHVNLAAYSVISNANGTVVLSMGRRQTFDPKALKEALAAAGVAAVVKVGAFCRTVDQPPGFTQVVVPTAASGQAAPKIQAVHLNAAGHASRTAVVISPSQMPRRAELSIGYFPDHVAMTLVATHTRLTCGVADPANCRLPSAAVSRAYESTGPAAAATLPASGSTMLTASASTLASSATATLSPSAASVTATLPALPPSATAPSATAASDSAPSATALSATTTVAPSATTTGPGEGPSGWPAQQVPVGEARLPAKGKWCQFTVSAGSQAGSSASGATTTAASSATTTLPGPASTTTLGPAGQADPSAQS